MAKSTMAPVDKTNGSMHHTEQVGLFELLQREMDRFWHASWPFESGLFPFVTFTPPTRYAFVPRLDVFEKEGAFIVKAELPGLKKEDIEVELADGDLVIKGEHIVEKEVKEAVYHRTERVSGRFYRRIRLGFEVAPEQITATLTDGVLEVKVPMPVEAAPETAHKIPVK